MPPCYRAEDTAMTDLIDTTEMYLRTILELEEENIVPLRARISERLGHSGPTVSQTVGRMERDGLVVVSEDRTLELTDAGRQKAVDVMRKHRLAERLLSDVIGLDWAYRARRGLPLGARHERAGRASPRRAARASHRVAVRQPDPGSRPARRRSGEPLRAGCRRVSCAGSTRRASPITGTVRRLAEPAQVDPELLQQLKSAGVLPGATRRLTATARATCWCRWTATTRVSSCPSRSRRTSSWSTTATDRSAGSIRSAPVARSGICQRVQRDRFVTFR